jgi:hypothetical protein
MTKREKCSQGGAELVPAGVVVVEAAGMMTTMAMRIQRMKTMMHRSWSGSGSGSGRWHSGRQRR